MPLPATTETDLRELYVFRDFSHFVELFMMGGRCLRTADDYELVAYELGTELARQGVRYAEVTSIPSDARLLDIPTDTYEDP